MSSVEKNRIRVKRHYEKHRISGIYKIINKIDNKYYVGSSNVINRRWYQHKLNLKNNKHRNNHLQFSWNKYGEANFDFMIVEEAPKENLIDVEQKYLDIAKNEQDICYNQSFDARGGNVGRVAYEMRSKKYSGVNHHQFGKHHTEETKQKMRQSKINMGGGANHPLYGRKRPQISGILHPNYDSTTYTFCHKKTNEVFSGSKYEFCKKINVRGVYRIISGKGKVIKGWEMINVKPSRLS